MKRSDSILPQEIVDAIEDCANIWGYPVEDLRGLSRIGDLRDARHSIITTIKKSFSYISLADLGSYFNRDHSTVLNSIKATEKSCMVNKKGTPLNKKFLETHLECLNKYNNNSMDFRGKRMCDLLRIKKQLRSEYASTREKYFRVKHAIENYESDKLDQS